MPKVHISQTSWQRFTATLFADDHKGEQAADFCPLSLPYAPPYGQGRPLRYAPAWCLVYGFWPRPRPKRPSTVRFGKQHRSLQVTLRSRTACGQEDCRC